MRCSSPLSWTRCSCAWCWWLVLEAGLNMSLSRNILNLYYDIPELCIVFSPTPTWFEALHSYFPKFKVLRCSIFRKVPSGVSWISILSVVETFPPLSLNQATWNKCQCKGNLCSVIQTLAFGMESTVHLRVISIDFSTCLHTSSTTTSGTSEVYNL